MVIMKLNLWYLPTLSSAKVPSQSLARFIAVDDEATR
jgi:hypothetical protein